MTESSAEVRSVPGPLAWATAVVTTLSVVVLLLLELLLPAESSSPWGITSPVLGLLMALVCIACTVAASVDCWLACGRPRRRPAHDHLRGAWLLLAVACFAGGMAVVPWLLPAALVAYVAAQRAKARSQAA
jgi:hypothetical protein